MGKVSKALATAFLTVILLAIMTVPAAAAAPSATGPLACWNNCGIGVTE